MNSAISAQPVMKGPATTSKIGFIIKKATIANLYQFGALPKKFLAKAPVSVRVMLLHLCYVSMYCYLEQLLISMMFIVVKTTLCTSCI